MVEPKKEEAAKGSVRTAVILNRNARGVTEQMVATVKEVFGGDDGSGNVYVTKTGEEAEAAARAIMANPAITTVIPMGGDGTLTAALESLCRAVMEQKADLTMAQAVACLPVVAYIPMGTGNALGSVVGCPVPPAKRLCGPPEHQRLRALLEELKDVIASDPSKIDTVELPILEVTTTKAASKAKTEPKGNTDDATPSTTTAPASTHTTDLTFFAGGTWGSLFANVANSAFDPYIHKARTSNLFCRQRKQLLSVFLRSWIG